MTIDYTHRDSKIGELANPSALEKQTLSEEGIAKLQFESTRGYALLIRDAIEYLKGFSHSVFSTKEEWEKLYRNNLKNQEFDKEASQNLDPEQMTIAERQDMSESPNFEIKPTVPLEKAPILSEISSPKKIIKNPITTTSKSQDPLHQKNTPNHLKNFLQHSSLILNDHIPEDTAATRAMFAWQEHIGDFDIVILACDNDAKSLALIKSLAQSIDQKLTKTKILSADRFEKEEKWEAFLEKNPLKLIIATSGFIKLKNAMRYYAHRDSKMENSEHSFHCFLKDIALIILSEPSVYTHSLQEKIVLWKKICNLLQR